MKKNQNILTYLSIITTLFLVVVLTACGSEPEPIEFSSVTIPGFEVEIQTSLTLRSDNFDLQGHLIEDEPIGDEDLLALLEDLEIDIPVIPESEFKFELELISYVFYHEESDEIQEYPRALPLPNQTQIQTVDNDSIIFPRITFEDAGVFTYRISQINEAQENWYLATNYVDLVVTITENLETESLEATIVKRDEPIFINIFEYDISETVQIIIQERWEIRVAEAYHKGYEYVKNEDGEYERVAIYIPTEPPTEAVAATNPPTQPPVANNPPPPPASNIPEDNAVTISNADALSYLALVNRNFRLSSAFSPGDLSTVNVQSIHGVHSMRQTAARALENLFQAAADAGHTLVASSGYRSYATQQATHNHWIATMGEAEARRVSARPGHSEHQLGLAMDVTTPSLGGLSSAFSSTPEGTWVRENAHLFGFIVRYPAGREADTGFIYEPWHLRFIGVDSATQMFGSGLILEQFLGVQ